MRGRAALPAALLLLAAAAAAAQAPAASEDVLRSDLGCAVARNSLWCGLACAAQAHRGFSP
jgi:hypothetical protein